MSRAAKSRAERAFNCDQCGKRCVPGQGGLSHVARRFCSPYCSGRWQYLNVERHTIRRKKRHARAQRKLAAALLLKRTAVCWVAGPCAVCGENFVALFKHVRTCSPKCMRIHKGATTGTHHHRARHYGVEREAIQASRVFERDDYHCGICGEATEKGKRAPHPLAPTLDHVVPMSRGGPHLYSNLQCAHFRCNVVKHNSADDQLAFAA